jgi:hypothetical protein
MCISKKLKSDQKTQAFLRNDASTRKKFESVESYFKKTLSQKSFQINLSSENDFFDQFRQMNPMPPKELVYFNGFSKF